MAAVWGWHLVSWDPCRRFCTAAELNQTNTNSTLWIYSSTSLNIHQLKNSKGEWELCATLLPFCLHSLFLSLNCPVLSVTEGCWSRFSWPCCHLMLCQRPDVQPKLHQEIIYPSNYRSFCSIWAVRRFLSTLIPSFTQPLAVRFPTLKCLILHRDDHVFICLWYFFFVFYSLVCE